MSKIRFPRYQIQDFLELIFGTVAIISAILTIITFFKEPPTYIYIIFMAVLFATSLTFFVLLIKFKIIAENRLRHFPESFHKLTHLIRDEFYNLQRMHEDKKLSTEKLLDCLQKTAHESVNILSLALSTSTDRNISVCIKYFPIDEPILLRDEKDYKNISVKTLCRSSNSNLSRNAHSIHKVFDNTHFKKIMMEKLPHFSAYNIYELSDKLKDTTGMPYQNSNPNWEDYYKSAITVPIRMESKYVPKKISKSIHDGSYDLLGFVCVDSPSTSAFRKNDIDFYVQYIKAYADLLYQYFDRAYCYFQLLSAEEKRRDIK